MVALDPEATELEQRQGTVVLDQLISDLSSSEESFDSSIPMDGESSRLLVSVITSIICLKA